MSKKIYWLVILSLCFIIFSSSVKAYQSSNVVMSSSCNINKNCPEESDCWENDEKDNSTLIVRYTDNSGSDFISLRNSPSFFKTKSSFIWLTGAKSLKDGGKSIPIEDNFNNSYCPVSIGAAPGILENAKDELLISLIAPTISFVKGINDRIKETSFAIDNGGAAAVWHEKKPSLKSTKLEHSRYIIYEYKIKNSDNLIPSPDETKTIAEGYSTDGKYCFVGQNIVNIMDEIVGHQGGLIANTEYVGPEKYFKVDEVYASLQIAGNGTINRDIAVCKGKSKVRCENENDFKILVASSGDGYDNLKKGVSGWINDVGNNEKLSGFNNIIDISKDKNFIDTCKKIKDVNEKKEEYDLSDINMDSFIGKLEKGYDALIEAYDVSFKDCATDKKTSVTSSITSCVVYSDLLGIEKIVDLAENKTDENMLNQKHIVSAIYSDVGDILKEELQKKNLPINIVDASSDLNKYNELFYTAALYIRSEARKGKIDLTDEQLARLSNDDENGLLYKFRILGEKTGVFPVVDCESLLGDKLVNKIESYINIIKIAVPIILIGFGVFDFTKAVLAGEDEMTKAKKKFIKRLAIAVLIFITPTIIKLLLLLANEVWGVISPDSCGIF